MIGAGLPQYYVTVVVDGKVRGMVFHASGFGHAEEQAYEAHPDGRIVSIHELPEGGIGE